MKKILAILLTVCMVVCMIPGAAFADPDGEGTSQNTIDLNNITISLKNGETNFTKKDLSNDEKSLTRDALEKVVVTYTPNMSVNIEEGAYTVTSEVNSDASSVRIRVSKNENASNLKNTYTGVGNYEDFAIKHNVPSTWGIKSDEAGTKDTFAQAEYTGKEITPTAYVFDVNGNTKTAVPSKYYTVRYQKNINRGIAKIIVEGTDKYSGTIGEATFDIASTAIKESMITIQAAKLGDAVETFKSNSNNSNVKVTCGGTVFTDYTFKLYKGTGKEEYKGDSKGQFEAGTYKVVVTCGDNKNLKGEASKTFVVDKAFGYNDVTVTSKSVPYDGIVQSGDVTVKEGNTTVSPSNKTYTITYQKNGVTVNPVNVGTYDVVLTDVNGGKRIETGALTITQRNLTKTAVDGHYAYTSGLNTNYSYSGKMTDPTFNVYWYHKGTSTLLKKGTGYDYTTTYSYDYIRGKGSVTINFTGNFSGSITETFTIQRGNELSNYTVYIPNIADQAYTGTYVKPYVSVYYGGPTAVTARTLLTEGVHYTLSYTSNINAGTATVTVTGKGAYSGTVTKNFNIKYNLSNATVTTTPATYAYDGRIKQPAVTVKIGYVTVPASDYIVTYSNNLKVGTATATVTAKTYGKSMGSNMAYFTITGKDGVITPEYAEFSKKTTKSNPFAIKIVSNTTDGTGYSYVSSDTSVATVSANGTVTPVGCGRTVITITTTGNRAYNPATATVTVTVKPTKGIISSLKSTAKGKLTVRYKKQSPNADYYQIRYGRAGDYTTKTIKNTTALTGKSTIKSLNSGKKYYVKVRGVKVLEDGTRLYGTWSVTKNAVTK